MAELPLKGQEVTFVSSPLELKRLSLAELLNTPVTTVSRQPEPASRAAAAVEVITQEQIARTGATSIPDAMRLAAGVQVSRGGGHSYAISSRGFSSLAANKLLVMQDGRSLYSPLFSGVFWDAYGVMMEDIDRIEIIRGPGATMWGANAVNGVINIISKEARDTQGVLVTAGGGTEERGFAAARLGGTIGESTFYRVYGRFHARDEMAYPDGGDASDRSREGQGGFRVDTQAGDQNHFTLQGDYFYNQFDLMTGSPAVNRSGNILGRWKHTLGADSDIQLQTYYDRFERNVPGQFGEYRNTFDADLQFRRAFGERHEFIAGLDYRLSSDETRSGGTIEFQPQARTIHIFSGFLQDEITLVPGRLSLVLGSKFEWNSLDGVEPQPSVRVAWTPADRQTVWAAVSRAVRMPSRIDEDLRFIPNPATGFVVLQGSPDFAPEEVLAYELGYRFQPHETISVDVAGYYNDYDDLRSLEPTPVVGFPLVQHNLLEAATYGVEVSVKYQVAEWWRLNGSYTWLNKHLRPQPGSNDPNGGALEGNDSPHLFSLWSSMDLSQRVTLDAVVRYVHRLPNPAVPAYVEMDLRVAWRPTNDLELSLVGQNLLDNQHREWGAASATAAEVQRGVYGKVTWRF